MRFSSSVVFALSAASSVLAAPAPHGGECNPQPITTTTTTTQHVTSTTTSWTTTPSHTTTTTTRAQPPTTTTTTRAQPPTTTSSSTPSATPSAPAGNNCPANKPTAYCCNSDPRGLLGLVGVNLNALQCVGILGTGSDCSTHQICCANYGSGGQVTCTDSSGSINIPISILSGNTINIL